MPSYRTVFMLVVLLGGIIGSFGLGWSQPSSVTPQQQSVFVGSEICEGCHAQLMNNFRTTPHAKLLLQQQAPPEHHGCEACHGPGEAHVNAGGGKGVGGLFTFRDTSAKARSEVCLTCHQKEVQLFQFRRSEHKLTGVACNDCHQPHFPVKQAGLLKQQTPDLCFSCHQEIRRDFALPVRHKVLEGIVTCTDCHTPHGSLSRPSLRGVHNTTCTRCHTEKDGPFAFEHLASRVEGCTVCHMPHGSTNKFLLKRYEQRILCLECHSNAPLSHNQAAGAFFRGACTRCHTEIHGSNFDRLFFH